MKPISAIENKNARVVHEVTVRPFTKKGIDLFRNWIQKQSWEEIKKAESVDEKVQVFQSMLMSKCNEFLPTKVRKIYSDDQPFCSEKMKRLKRQKNREYHKHRRSAKWKDLNKLYKTEVSKAKKDFYVNMVQDLKNSNPAHWYSKLKRLCSFDQHKSEPIIVESIKHLSDQEQSEVIANKFASVSQEYDPLNKDDISVPNFCQSTVPNFTPSQVKKKLLKVKTNKAVPPDDIPPKLIKLFASEISVPLSDIINTSVSTGSWSKSWKAETVTPVPKVFPPKSLNDLRNISGLKTFNKIAEQLLSELIIADMTQRLDRSQFANQKNLSLQHYLVRMIHKILVDTDHSSEGEATAVIATLYDWKEAFPRQCPKLGVEAFIKCGVRPSLIPVLISYLQDRTMRVKWHGCMSSEKKLNGGTAQGGTFGIWGYMAQSNDNADCVPQDYRFKFVDDLSVLETVNLLATWLSSFNCKVSVPSNLPLHNQIIDAKHLKSQHYLDEIEKWTESKKMILNVKKTKAMIFNFTQNYQFTTNLKLQDEVLEIVKETKLLGVIITDDLKWDRNTEYLVKKAYMRMEILRKTAEFTNNIQEKRTIYILYIRSILEQSCVVWHSSLTVENSEDLERVQKSAVRIIIGNKFENYENALIKANLQKLSDRREQLCLKFARQCLQSDKNEDIFPLKRKNHRMKTRKQEIFEVNKFNTERMKNSAILNMQRLLNEDFQKKRNIG